MKAGKNTSINKAWNSEEIRRNLLPSPETLISTTNRLIEATGTIRTKWDEIKRTQINLSDHLVNYQYR